MNSIADGSGIIQSISESVPSTSCWFGEVMLRATFLCPHGVLGKISERVRFARRRFGQSEAIDVVAVRFGEALSGELTRELFSQRPHTKLRSSLQEMKMKGRRNCHMEDGNVVSECVQKESTQAAARVSRAIIRVVRARESNASLLECVPSPSRESRRVWVTQAGVRSTTHRLIRSCHLPWSDCCVLPISVSCREDRNLV